MIVEPIPDHATSKQSPHSLKRAIKDLETGKCLRLTTALEGRFLAELEAHFSVAGPRICVEADKNGNILIWHDPS